MKGKETTTKRPVAQLNRSEVLPIKSQHRRSDKLRSILAATTDFCGTWNLSARSLCFNRQSLSALGFSAADWPHGQVPVVQLMHSDDREAFEAQLHAHLAGKVPRVDCPLRLQTRAGTYRWFQIRAEAIQKNRRGVATEVAYAGHDIHAAQEEQQRILESQEWITAVLNACPDVISVVDPTDFALITFNRAFADLMERAHGVRVTRGMHAKDLAPERAAVWEALFGRALAERSLHCEYDVPGVNLTHEVLVQAIEREGAIRGICTFGHDISDRKRMEAAALRSEEKFSKAFRQAPLAVSLTSLRSHRFLDVNDHYAEATGYSREELLGRTPYELDIWVEPAKRAEMVRKVVETGEAGNIELLYRTKSGKVREAVGSAAQIEIDSEPCMLAIVMDVTERRRAQEALRESEERLRIAIEAGHMYAFEWNVTTDVVLRSEQSQRILAIPVREMKHTKQELIDRMLPDDRQQYMAVLRAITPERPYYKAVFRLQLGSGNIAWLEESGRAVFGPDGTLSKIIGITSDVTQIRESERALGELSGRLITSQEEERRRIARELHDHIGQEAALLCVQAQQLEAKAAGDGHSVAAEMHELHRRLKVLVGDVSKLSHRLHCSDLTLLGLSVAAERLCQDFAHQCDFHLDYQIESLPSQLDSMRSLCIYRVLEEALQNVVKHSHASRVTVQLRMLESRVALSVADDGDGFDAEKVRLGLGLLGMRERLRFVGGTFRIVSAPGRGTILTADVAA